MLLKWKKGNTDDPVVRLAKGYQVFSVILQCLIPEFSETAVLWNIHSLQ